MTSALSPFYNKKKGGFLSVCQISTCIVFLELRAPLTWKPQDRIIRLLTAGRLWSAVCLHFMRCMLLTFQHMGKTGTGVTPSFLVCSVWSERKLTLIMGHTCGTECDLGGSVFGTRLRTYKFNEFHVRALCYTKNINHQQMHKESFFIYCNTLLHVSTQTSGDHKEFTPSKAANCTVNSTFSLNCIVQPSVRTTESFSLKMTQQGRKM
jgi:hypothetical protein